MKKIAISAALFSSLLCGSAMAADVYTGTEESNPFEQGLNNFEGLSYDWSGFYIGATGAYKITETKAVDSLYNFDLDGVAGGIYTGYNFHFDNNVVVGVEGDIVLGNIKARIIDAGEKGYADFKNNRAFSVRGRLGYAFNQVMPYVTGGVTYGSFSSSSGIPSIGTAEVKSHKVGGTVGAGVDFAMLNNIILKTEYRYAKYGEINHSNIKASSNEVRVGVAYKF